MYKNKHLRLDQEKIDKVKELLEVGTDAERAMSMLSDYVENVITLIAPGLFPYEILSGINVAVNRKRIGQEAGKEAVNYILSLGVQLRTSHDLFVSAFQLAREHGLSTYDCAYISLAQKESW
jgi:predicted nucleic acid-binding protein